MEVLALLLQIWYVHDEARNALVKNVAMQPWFRSTATIAAAPKKKMTFFNTSNGVFLPGEFVIVQYTDKELHLGRVCL